MNREMIRQNLKDRKNGLLGMAVGSGLYFKYAEMNDVDLIFVFSAGRFRQMGMNSLAATMPFENSNRLMFDVTRREILPYGPKIPVIFGLCATDPTIDQAACIRMLKELGVSGICNLPSMIIIDGQLGEAMEASGLSYRKEVEAVATAHSLDMFTVAMVKNTSQAQMMIEAGADAVCVHFGAAKGGLLGAKEEVSLKYAVEMARQVYDVCAQSRRTIFKLFYGGPAKTPASVRYIKENAHADGFVGGYSIERLFIENTIGRDVLKQVFLGNAAPQERTAHIDYAEYVKEYVEQHYRETLTINSLAEQLHISRPYLSALLSRELGMSFKSYLISYRMEKAAHFLANTTLSVQEIAEAVGYADAAHFSKSFKKFMSMNPASFRKNNTKTHK